MRKSFVIAFLCCFFCIDVFSANVLVRTLQKKDGLSDNKVTCVYCSERGDVFIGTGNGLNVYDGVLVRIIRNSGFEITSICQMPDGLYVGAANGLFLYNAKEDALTRVNVRTEYNVNIFCRVNCLARQGDNLLVGTDGEGLFLFDTKSGKLFQRSRNLPFVKSLSIENNNSVLVAEKMTGLSRIRISDLSVEPIAAIPDIDNLFRNGNNVWFTSADGVGFFRQDSSIVYNSALKNVLAFSEYGDGKMLVTEQDGLYVVDTYGNAVETLYCHVGSLPVTDYSSAKVIEDNEGNLWVPLRSSGLIRAPFPRIEISFDNAADIVSQFSCTDHNGNVFKTENRHVFRYDIFGKTTDVFLMDNTIQAIFCDRNGDVWAGTRENGLFKYRDSKFTPISFEPQDIPMSCVYSIQQDASGYLWLSTNLGIVRLNPSGETSEVMAGPEILPQNGSFVPGMIETVNDGKIRFITTDVILAINPSEFVANSYAPQVNINAISCRGGEKTFWNLSGSESLRIPYNLNAFTIHFSIPSYIRPENNVYRYKLSGYDSEMSEWSNASSTSYSNLSPGRYVFVVEGKNNDGISADTATTLTIVVQPVWWNSVTARIIYILLAVALVFYFYWMSRRKMNERVAGELLTAQKNMEIDSYKQRMNFFLGMVHEIRTPLTMMKLSLDSLKSDPSQKDTSVTVLDENLDYIHETINGILNFHNGEASGSKLLFVRTDLGLLCRDVIGKFKDTADLKKLRFSENIPDEPVFVMADETFFSKIIVNLLSNAFKYAKSEVALSLRTKDGVAEIVVSDDGPGVKESEQEKIFGMFYKVAGDKIAEASGMGIGLAYSRQLAEAHGGTLTEQNLPLSGASFILKVPLIIEKVIAQTENIDGMTVSADTTAYKVSVLVVDDNADLLSMLRRELSVWYVVYTAENGAEALNILKEQEVDVVVSDVMMPVMDGLELCREMKSKLEYSHIPFIMLTAKVSVESKTEGLGCGANVYVEKPFSIQQLHSQIQNLLQLRKSSQIVVMDNAGMQLPMIQDVAGRLDKEFVDKINSLIESQISKESFSIDQLAGEMCMSKSNFYKKFHAVTGSSPNEYLKNFRLNRAAKMILEGAKINEAAMAMGYYSSSYFAKCFLAKFGVLPKDYINHFKNER